MLEVLAFMEDDLKKLDRLSVSARKFYFMRNIFRTQNELYSAIQTVRSNKEFKELVAQYPEERKKLDDAWQTLNSHELLKEVRNDVGGHIKHTAVKKALGRLSEESFGYLQVGENAAETQYGFSHNIAVAMLMKGVTKRERIRLRGSRKFKKLRAYLVLLTLADICFLVYALDRGIAPF
jgi:hypothetical protein